MGPRQSLRGPGPPVTATNAILLLRHLPDSKDPKVVLFPEIWDNYSSRSHDSIKIQLLWTSDTHFLDTFGRITCQTLHFEFLPQETSNSEKDISTLKNILTDGLQTIFHHFNSSLQLPASPVNFGVPPLVERNIFTVPIGLRECIPFYWLAVRGKTLRTSAVVDWVWRLNSRLNTKIIQYWSIYFTSLQI